MAPIELTLRWGKIGAEGGGGDLGFIGAGVWEGLEGVQPLA
jgi:hypothetical protein